MSQKVTVVVLIHDHPELLSESLDSILEQTYPNIEIIVAGPATENNNFRDILGQYKDRLIYCETENISRGLIMNEALKMATGELLVCMDAGDIFLPEKTELQVGEFEKNPEYGVVLTGCQIVDEDGNIRSVVDVPDSSHRPLLFFLLYGSMFNGGKGMMRRECYDKVGEYRDCFAAEHDMWIRLARHYGVGVINIPLVKQRVYPMDKESELHIHTDTQRIICEAMNSTSLEDIFPHLQSHPENLLARSSAYAATGSILMMYELHEDAGDRFTKAHQLCPDNSLHRMWLGILPRQTEEYDKAMGYFAEIPEEDGFYLDARIAATLTQAMKKASGRTGRRLRGELAKERNLLLNFTLDLADGKTPGSNQLLSEIVEEIQEYLGWDSSQVLGALIKGGERMREEWNQNPPETRDEIVDFYKETENYIFDLAWWHRDQGRRQVTKSSMDICRENGAHKVLEFGCGTGQDGILFAEAGFDVTLADLPGKLFDYAKWRVERRGLDIEFANSDKLVEKYDAIICFDVLEHVWDPKEIVEYLHEHLSDNGILLVTTHFGHDEEHPMHLGEE